MPEERIGFAIIGLDHNHVYNHIRILLNAGAEFVSYYSGKPGSHFDLARKPKTLAAYRKLITPLNRP